MNKLVTVITPCHNAGDTIAQTIDSVLAQTYPNWEMIVVDDGSTDNSAEIIQDYALRDSRIKYFKTKKASGSPALPRNIGLDNAKGDYIAFLDADDLWLPEKLEKQLRFAEENKRKFVYSNYEKISHDGRRSNRIVNLRNKSTFWDIMETCSIPCLTVLLSRSIIGKTRFIDAPKEDFIFWIDILKTGMAAYNVGETTAMYREQKGSRSANKFDMIKKQWYVLRKIEGVKPIVATYFMTVFLIKGLLKYLK